MGIDADAIGDAAAKPKRVSQDGLEVEMHSLPDQIAAAEFAARKAAARNPFNALNRRQMEPPGAG